MSTVTPDLKPAPAPGDSRIDVQPGQPTPAAPPTEGDAASTTSGVLLVCIAAVLSSGAAGWMLAGVFDSLAARLLALLGALVGSSVVAFSYRMQRPALAQYVAFPVALLTGALVVSLSGATGSASLPRLVSDALFSGGIGQPPVPFDPGWQFILVATITLLGAGSASLALGYDKPNLAVGLSVPLILAGSLIQPEGAELLSVIVAFVLVIAGLAVAYGVELAKSGVSSGQFELLRLLRGLAALVALAGGLFALANVASFLLPEAAAEQVIPPQRPPKAPPQTDRELFTVATDRKLPWRLGVLDVYEDNAWKTPPFDPARFIDLDGAVPDPVGLDQPEIVATFEVVGLQGRVVPVLAAPHTITVEGDALMQFDPRTQALRLGALATPGLRYTVTAAAPASTQSLADAPPPSERVAEFLSVPPPPPGVVELLDEAPGGDAFTRLQFVREAYYARVLAAGAGDPIDVSPARVDEMLDGKEASPYEITAGEALLARWVGVPSRIGYGYFGGDALASGDGFSLRPKNGATWLEAYFEGQGWIPIVGKPPRAKSSFTDSEKNEDASVRPTDELALITYVPIRQRTITLLFEVVRFYLLQIIPVVLGLVALFVFYPAGLRRLRRSRRRRWGESNGPAAQIAVAYAELRDTAWDLNVGRPSDTPLEFVDRVSPDAEHVELAWLVTRAIWGDLSRDLTSQDVVEAREMTGSVLRRLRGAQTTVTRMLAAAARASLKDPYSDELPNAWYELHITRRLKAPLRATGRLIRGLARLADPRRVRSAAAMILVLLAVLGSSGCAAPLDLETAADPAVLPSPAVPASIDDIGFQREPGAEVAYQEGGAEALVTSGQVYTVRRGDVIEASLQIAALRPGLQPREAEVREGILRALGGGRFVPIRLGQDRVNVFDSVEQRLLLWFSPSGQYYQLMVARKSFEDANRLFEAVLAFQRGEQVDGLDRIVRVEALDPRKGIAE
ncbi:MAG: hypothetical protein ACI867_000021 [Glaciecola sp.]|jgi:hypothetical protein